jgi:hypothetical protein
MTLQRLWGLLFLLCLARLAYDWWSERWRRPVLVVALVALAGLPGALTGPAGSDATTRWYWVTLAVAALFASREAARRIPLQAIATVMAASGAVTVLLVLIDPYGQTGDVAVTFGSVSELSGGYLSPHTLAFSALALLAWTLVLSLAAKDPRLKAAGIALSIGLAMITILTTIRAAQLGLAVLLVFYAAAFANRRGWSLRGARGKLAVGGVVALLLVTAVAVPSVRHRWLDVYQAGEGRSFALAGSARGYLWRQAWLDFQELSPLHKLIGSGLGTSAILTNARVGQPFWAHTDLLELLVSVGVAGTIVVLALVVALGFWIARARGALRRRGSEWLWLLGLGTALAFIPVALLVGFLTYPSATVPSLALIGYVLGRADAPEEVRARRPKVETLPTSWTPAHWRWAAIGLGAYSILLVAAVSLFALYMWG